jgi:transcription elongation factor Elf1
MLWIDYQYVNQLGYRLDGFVKKKDSLWNARCPFCGDSSNKRKKRFYIFRGIKEFNDHLVCKCHNCGTSGTLRTILKRLDADLYKEYMLDVLKDSNPSGVVTKPFKQTESVLPADKDDFLKAYDTINELQDNHPAKMYCLDRKLPTWALDMFRWTYDFKTLASKLNKDTSDDLMENDPRIVIPFFDIHGDVVVLQGRTIGIVRPKYITVKLNQSVDKFFGEDRIDKNKPIIVVEGPLDSLFVNNGIATGDADLTRYKGAASYVYDNQPRNPVIVKRIQKTVDEGYPVFIWPNDYDNGKDINDMIINGKIDKNFSEVILANTYKGLKAKMMFNQWKKV